jgi:triphosphatase
VEVEIKLNVLPTVEGGPAAFFERLAAQGSLAGRPLGPVEAVAMRDIYYDTPDGALARASAGLRLRIENGAAFITLKIARRQEGSLAVREEYEHRLDDIHFDQVVAYIRPLIGPEPVPLADFAAGRPAGPLVPVLDVMTDRIARQVGALGVLTLDRVSYAGLAVDPFFDIEVEAEVGLGGEAQLREVEAELIHLAGGHLAPASVSKLARGLGLKAQRTSV